MTKSPIISVNTPANVIDDSQLSSNIRDNAISGVKFDISKSLFELEKDIELLYFFILHEDLNKMPISINEIMDILKIKNKNRALNAIDVFSVIGFLIAHFGKVPTIKSSRDGKILIEFIDLDIAKKEIDLYFAEKHFNDYFEDKFESNKKDVTFDLEPTDKIKQLLTDRNQNKT